MEHGNYACLWWEVHLGQLMLQQESSSFFLCVGVWLIPQAIPAPMREGNHSADAKGSGRGRKGTPEFVQKRSLSILQSVTSLTSPTFPVKDDTYPFCAHPFFLYDISLPTPPLP